MTKRTAIFVARSTVVFLTLLVGVLFSGHNFAFADITSTSTDQGNDQSVSQLVDSFLTGGINFDDSSASTSTEVSEDTATSTAVGGSATTTDFETSTSTSATTTEATTTDPFVGTGSTPPFEIGSTTNATSTGTTTTSTASTTLPILDELATTTNATTTATTPIIPITVGIGDDNSTTTSSTLELLLATTTVATTSDLIATSTATTTQSFRAKYYRYDYLRTDMAGWGIPFDEIQGIDPGDPLDSAWTKDWFTSGFLKFTSIENRIRFKDRFAPFANSTDLWSDPEAYIAAPNFGVHFMGLATVSEEGDYTVTITTDGDAWFYMDRVLQLKNLSGIKPAETLTKTIHMIPGQHYTLNMLFTERIALYPYFDFTFPGVTITPCNDDSCEPPVLNPDITGPTAPVVTSPIPPISSTTTDITIPISWTNSVDPEILGDITSGLRGYIYVWDQIATTTPTLETGTLTTSTSTVITNLTPGIWWFHVIAIDNAGNTSAPTTHHGPFCIGLASCGDTPNIFTLNYSAGANGTITGTTSQTVNLGENGTEVIAVANSGYHFVNWSDGVTTASRTDTNVQSSISVTANFAADSVPPVEPPHSHSSSGGSSRIVSITPIATTTTTTTITTPAVCKLFLLKFIKLGADNDPVEVLKLQAFLRVFEGRDDVPLSGFYDLVTYNAVKDFQKKYGLDVLNPWGIGDSTGYVFITTTLKINYIYCNLPTRITLDLRNFYPAVGEAQFVKAPQVEEPSKLIVSTSTSKILPLATASSTLISTSTKNSVQLAFAGITDFLVRYPWVWILLLLLLVAFVIWVSRSKEEGQEEKQEEKQIEQIETPEDDLEPKV